MATLQEMIAKRNELKTTNPNASMADARQALSPSPVANAPVAGVAPAVTNPVGQNTTPVAPTAPVSVHDNANYQNSTTESFNQGVRARNQANVQGQIQAGERPQVGQQATPAQTPEIIQQAQTQTAKANTPVTTTETPTTPTETTPTSTTTKKTEDSGLPANLQQAIDDAKNGTVRKFESTTPVITPDSNSIYANLRTNTPLPDSVKTTTAYKDAQTRYNNFQKYASYDVNTLTTALGNGTILPGTSTWNDLMTDPVMSAKILQAKAFTNGKGADIVTTTQQASDNIVANSPTVSGMLADGYITPQEWAQATNTPEVKAKMADVEAKKNSYDTLKSKHDAVEDDVKAEYANRDVRGSFLDSIVADRRKAMFKELTIAGDTYNNALGTLTQLKTDASSLFETNMKLYQDQIKAQQDKAQQDKQFAQSIALKQMDYAQQQATPSFQTIGDKVYKVQNGQMTEVPGITTRKFGEMTDREKMDLAYQYDIGKIKTQAGIEASKPVWQEWEDSTGKHAGWVTPGVNPTTGTPTTTVVQPTPEVIKSLSTRLQGDNVQCGMVTNDYAAKVFPQMARMGDSYESKVKAVESIGVSNTPQVGGVFAMKIMGSNTGHTGIVQSISADGKYVTVTDANKSGSVNGGPVTTSTYPIANMIFSKGPQTQGSPVAGQYTDEQVNNLAYLVDLQEKNPTEASKQMRELGYKPQDMANFKAGNVPLTEKQKNSSIEVMNAIADLADSSKYEWNDAVGFLAGTPSLSGGDAATATMAIDNIVAKMTLPNLGVLKGPMSDKDIAFIQAASSKLSRDQSDVSFEKNLIDAYNIAARRSGRPEIKKLSDINSTAQAPTVGGELDYSKYEPNN